MWTELWNQRVPLFILAPLRLCCGYLALAAGLGKVEAGWLLQPLLRERLEPATVEAAEVLGWSSDALEAQAFGFLAARGLKGLPLSYPATTGVPMPMTGGVIARP